MEKWLLQMSCWLYKNKDWYKEKWRTRKYGGPLGINLVHDIDLLVIYLDQLNMFKQLPLIK